MSRGGYYLSTCTTKPQNRKDVTLSQKKTKNMMDLSFVGRREGDRARNAQKPAIDPFD
jgi:hypothetical protein